jgi:hypothetical protein
MQLRHIRPRSVEWYDALEWGERKGFDGLSPEEALRLRTLVAVEGEMDRLQTGDDKAPPLQNVS